MTSTSSTIPSWVSTICAWLAVFALLFVGGYLRLGGSVFWRLNAWVHPDENRIVIANGDIDFSRVDWSRLDPRTVWSNGKQRLQERNEPTWNPVKVWSAGFERDAIASINPRFFAYGSLPIYCYDLLQDYVGKLRRSRDYEWIPYQITGIYELGRLTSGVLGTLTILCTFLLAWRCYRSRAVAVLSAAFLTFCVLHLQLSHFLTTDVILTFFVTLSLWLMTLIIASGSAFAYLAVGIVWGMTLATKANALMLAPLILGCHGAYLVRSGRWKSPRSAWQWGWLAVALLLAGLVFAVSMPFGVLDFNQFRNDLTRETNFVRGISYPLYMFQYANTPRYLYQLQHLFYWSAGPPLGLLMLLGWLYAGHDAIRRFRWEKLVPVLWGFMYFILVGNLFVKWLRHLIPVYPVLCIFAAVFLVEFARRRQTWWIEFGRVLLGGSVLLLSAAYSFAYLNVYFEMNPRGKSSYWIYANIPQGSRLLIEHWDESQPIAMPGYSPNRYESRNMEVYGSDHAGKIRTFSENLAWGDYLIVASRRLYGATMRNPTMYPHMNAYFRLLFQEKLGYELVQVFTTYPNLGGWELITDLADESYMVYDHPKTLIFKRVREIVPTETAQLILNPPDEVMAMTWEEMMLHTLPERRAGWLRLGDWVLRRKLPEPNWEELVLSPEARIARQAVAEQTSPAERRMPTDCTMYTCGLGPAPGQFQEPRDVALAPNGRIYVADFRNFRIQVFDSNGKPLRQWGNEGKEPGQFKDPSGLFVTQDGRVLVSDTWNHRLQVFDLNGTFIEEIRPPGNLYAPADLCVAANGDILVADAGNRRIARLSPQGEILHSYRTATSAEDALGEVFGVTVAPDGKVWAGDGGNNRLLIWNEDGSFAKAIALPPGEKERRSQIYLTTGDDGLIYVSDARVSRLQVYNTLGELLKSFDGTGLFESQMGLAVVPEVGDVIVANTSAHRVMRIPAASLKEIQ